MLEGGTRKIQGQKSGMGRNQGARSCLEAQGGHVNFLDEKNLG